ncbi:hypothetical protein [Wielerella bovis]|uniref:hypothetical protein n=1 Tax=Wielerella bovis TaxID=2917790 RepID=UPI002018B471|nr:hypothetical protein [Wielerella bovis]ULJ64822.1 hypothetical protein MIS33_00390 [Wielerella bovis]ULJ67094.1 hypothetical protein MIS31_00390 [Wielerella bovis]
MGITFWIMRLKWVDNTINTIRQPEKNVFRLPFYHIWIQFKSGQGNSDRRVHIVHKGAGNAVLV